MHNQGFSLLEKQILALHYNGIYISNFDFKKIADIIGIELDLADREKMLKTLLKKTKEANKENELMQAFSELFSKRVKEYQALINRFPEASEAIMPWIQKSRSIMMLLQQRLRMSPYE